MDRIENEMEAFGLCFSVVLAQLKWKEVDVLSTKLLQWVKSVQHVQFQYYLMYLQDPVLLGMDWFCWEKDMVTKLLDIFFCLDSFQLMLVMVFNCLCEQSFVLTLMESEMYY